MSPKDISNARDPDLQASLVAMQRAATLARKIAIQTETGIVIVRDQQLVRISSEELKEALLKEKSLENLPAEKKPE